MNLNAKCGPAYMNTLYVFVCVCVCNEWIETYFFFAVPSRHVNNESVWRSKNMEGYERLIIKVVYYYYWPKRIILIIV